jgi:hypothetical protein
MTYSPNTNGLCPHCERTFDAKKATIAFPGKATGMKISLIFALCPECYDTFSLADQSHQTKVVKISFNNIVKKRNTDWTVTTDLNLHAYFGDFFEAWWIGLDIPRPLFDAINYGSIEEVFFLPTLNYLTGGKDV